MKQTIWITALVTLTACNHQTGKNTADAGHKPARVDSVYIDSSDISGAGGQPHKEFTHCPFDRFVADKSTPQMAKDVYLGHEWHLDKDDEALALLDSLTAKDKSSRPFYFKVVTKTYKRADGYYSEGLGNAGKEYVAHNTQEFASYFDDHDCFTDEDLHTWAKIVVLEFEIIDGESANRESKPMIDGYCAALLQNSRPFSKSNRKTIEVFTRYLKEEWRAFLRNT